MKTIIFLFGILVLYSCENHTSIYVKPEGDIPFAAITHFEYKGHQYIKFVTEGVQSAIGGVVHDPNCKYCNK